MHDKTEAECVKYTYPSACLLSLLYIATELHTAKLANKMSALEFSPALVVCLQ